MQVKFDGNPIEVKGTQAKVGDKAPNATLKNAKGEAVELNSFFDKVTSDKDYQYVTVGRNTVDEFNQWNKENALSVTTLTDAKGEFGRAYGLDIELDGNALLTRAVFVIDADGIIQYSEIVDEVVNEPNYDAALEAADKLA